MLNFQVGLEGYGSCFFNFIVYYKVTDTV